MADIDRDGFMQEAPDKKYTDVATVLSHSNDLTAEEFPEGPYGSSLEADRLGKSTPWREDQRSPNTYTYENRELHAGMSRGYPGAHPTHDSDSPEEDSAQE